MTTPTEADRHRFRLYAAESWCGLTNARQAADKPTVWGLAEVEKHHQAAIAAASPMIRMQLEQLWDEIGHPSVILEFMRRTFTR